MCRSAHVVGVLVVAIVTAGCAGTAVEVLVAPDAARVQTGSRPPAGAYEQIGVVTATHGGGCGAYGRRGNFEGAHALLRNKAAKLGADYVQILRITEPHIEGICASQAFVIDGMAYRVSRGAPGQQRDVAPTRGLDGTYTGDITGNTQGQRFAMRVTFTLVQSGNQIAGMWSTTGGTSGTVTAILEQGRLTEFRARQVNPCPGDFVGDVAVQGDGNMLRGQYSGADCGGAVTASFEAARQQ
jgi:hypothetical protein